MSAKATFWAWEQRGLSSSQKLVLLCLADNHNEDSGQCNPSVAFVADKTGLNRKTILQAMADLETLGLIAGQKRFGATTNFYLKTSAYLGTAKNGEKPNTPVQKRRQTSTENGSGSEKEEPQKPVPKTVPAPESVPVPKTDITSTVFTKNQYRKRDTESKTESTKNLKRLNTLDFSTWPGVPSRQVWDDFKKHRRGKRASITQTVIDRMAPELQKLHAAGWSVDASLGEQMQRGWQGLKADWILKNGDLTHATHQPGSRKKSLAEQSWEESEAILADIEAREAGERSVAADAPAFWKQMG